MGRKTTYIKIRVSEELKRELLASVPEGELSSVMRALIENHLRHKEKKPGKKSVNDVCNKRDDVL